MILFICTGNVFRSMVAEYALKAHLKSDCGYVVGSAGIEALPQAIHPFIADCLRQKGADSSTHVQRKLTQALLDEAHLPVAMGLDHQISLRQRYQREALLFNEICFHKLEPILDLHEVIPTWQEDPEGSRLYVLSVIDQIWNAMPTFLSQLPRYDP